jgi:HlyD family secretion protein
MSFHPSGDQPLPSLTRTTMPRPGQVNVGLILSLLLNAALAAGVAYLIFLAPPKTTPGGNSPSGTPEQPAAGEVSALGRIQPSGGLIAVFGPPGDRITKFDVTLGQRVDGNRTQLATLSGEDERELQVKALAAQIEEAQALKAAILASQQAKLKDIDAEANQAKVAAEQDGNALAAKLRAVEAQRKRAVATKNRLEEVKAATSRVSAQEVEEADALLAQADAEKDATVAQQEKLKAVVKEGEKSVEAKKATVDAETKRALAQVPLTTLEANLKAAEQKLKSGRLIAPTGGRVVRFLSHPGDTVTTQPVLQLADTNKMVVLAEVYESDVGKVRQWLSGGKTVKAEVDMRVLSDGKKLTGTVADASKVATVVAKNILTPLGPREDADRRVVEVEVELDAASAAIAKDYIGLQVRVTLKPGG